MLLVVLSAIGCGSSFKADGPDAGPSDPGSNGGVIATGGTAQAGSTSASTLGTGGIGQAGASSTGAPSNSGGRISGGTTVSNATGGTAGAAGGRTTASNGGTSAGGRANSNNGGSSAGGAPTTSTKDAGASDGPAMAGNTGSKVDGGTAWNAGNPNASCSLGVPANGQPVDTSKPTSVIGDGSPGSCTFSKLQAAAKAGGIITFNCGDGPVTIPVAATLELPITKNTVFDGGRKITLDGGGAVRVMNFFSADYQKNDATVTLQHIALTNGKATPTEAIPTRPAPCSQGYNDGEGGAVFMRDGNLVVIDSIFTNNQAAPLGPDTGGGALYVLGSKNGLLIVGSTFIGNSASNAGAVGCLQSSLSIYNSLFQNNKATGHDANNDEPDKCSYINNDQNETGSGGNGGAIYNDGVSRDLMVCGTHVLNNAAGSNAFGGGLFFTSNDFGGVLSLIDTTMTGNTGGSWTVVKSGSVANVGTAIGTNAKSITVQNSNLQGMK
jgi:hypothetical protein